MPDYLNTRDSRTFPGNGAYFGHVSNLAREVERRAEHEEHVTDMNEVHRRASQQVQRGVASLASMIERPGHSTGHPAIPLEEETTMLKTISAALLAVSVLAAPALAAGTGKTAQAPVVKAQQVKQAKHVKPSLLNANAKMDRHHVRHGRQHRAHKHMGALKTHKFSKVTIKHTGSATKRG